MVAGAKKLEKEEWNAATDVLGGVAGGVGGGESGG